MKERLKIGIIGLGSRGMTYMRDEDFFRTDLELCAIADTDLAKLADFGDRYGVPAEGRFAGDRALFEAAPKLDTVFICTGDRFHYQETLEALRLGYHVLLEKPAGISLEETDGIRRAARESGRLVVVCHELRYAPAFVKVKELLDEGRIGELRTIQAVEQISFHHQSHSFVRGNCGRIEESSPMFLQKCSHDMDLMTWLTGRHCISVSSFANVMEFVPDNKPLGAPARCSDGCGFASSCPYDAVQQYYTDGAAAGKEGWPYEMVVPVDYSAENMKRALKSGKYGRCVYACGTTAVDHQVVNLQMEGGLLISFTMTGFTPRNGRMIHFFGSKGDIFADFDDAQTIEIRLFDGSREVIDCRSLGDLCCGHGGGDAALVRDFAAAIRGEAYSPNLCLLEETVESHYICQAAEWSRLHGGAPCTSGFSAGI